MPARALLLLVVAAVAGGCASPADVIPIRAMPDDVERPRTAPGAVVAVTYGGVIYVPPAELEAFLTRPPTLPRYALLEHERVHARRQREAFGFLWGVFYGISSSFRWKEERAGYARQIQVLREGGAPMLKAQFLSAVSDEFYGDMVSVAEASDWFDEQQERRP